MTEVVILKCDGVGCTSSVPAYPTPGSPEASELETWTKDDLDADICGKCVAKQLAMEEQAAQADLGALATVLNEETERLEDIAAAQGLEKTVDFSVPAGDLTPPKQKVTRAELDRAIEATVKEMRSILKAQKKSKKFIEEAIQHLKTQAEDLYEVT